MDPTDPKSGNASWLGSKNRGLYLFFLSKPQGMVSVIFKIKSGLWMYQYRQTAMVLNKPAQDFGKNIHSGNIHLPEKIVMWANWIFHRKLLDNYGSFAGVLGEIVQKSTFEGIGLVSSCVVVVDVEIPEYYWISPGEPRNYWPGSFSWVYRVQFGEIFHGVWISNVYLAANMERDEIKRSLEESADM